jgi:hypothetical protein
MFSDVNPTKSNGIIIIIDDHSAVLLKQASINTLLHFLLLHSL